MKHVRPSIVVLFAVVGPVVVQPQTGVASNQAKEGASTERPKTYTACNLWYEKPSRMHCINYMRGTMIPAGTEVSSVSVSSGRFSKPTIKFTTSNKMEYTIYFKKKFHPGVSIEKFKDRLFTKKRFDKLTKGLTKAEVDAIKAGDVTSGMSREAVLICLGFPAEHKTPPTERSSWVYWRSRFVTRVVHFGADGRTVE